jgi:1-acyl-sn-glycerol-3-phosphate acyltransferase
MPLWLRATLFSGGQVLSTILFAALGAMVLPCSFHVRYRTIHQWTRFNLWWLKKTCNIEYQVTGREFIPSEPSIIMCKHQSAWETLALQCVFPPHTWVLKRELLFIPFFGWGLAMLAPIAIDRSSGPSALRKTVEAGRKTLAAGRWIVVFPEGQRMPPGERGKYHVGGGTLATASGALVVPVAHDAGLYWPRHSFIKYPGTIKMVIGAPIRSQGKNARTLMAEVEEWIESTSKRLLDEATEHRCPAD